MFHESDNLLEHILGYATYRATPIIRDIFESCSRSNSVLRITLLGVICVTTRVAEILIHNEVLLSDKLNILP